MLIRLSLMASTVIAVLVFLGRAVSGSVFEPVLFASHQDIIRG